jgi:HD-GYP domain-containing protein (c-di-GMP phosphodiesterase class II)
VTKARDDLASEDARVTAAREALDAQITAARQELENESARLADMRQQLFEHSAQPHEPQPDPRPEPQPDRTSLSDARRILEEESARLMEALALDSTTPAARAALQPAILAAEASTDPTPPPASSNGNADAGKPEAYELGGPLPMPGALEELYPLLIERAAKLLNKERGLLKAEEQVAILGRALDDRDCHRAGYSERLAAWAEATAGMLGCERDVVADIRRASLLHDLGKIGVPEAILRAAARLTDQERRIVRSVPALAERVLRPIEGMQGVAAILRHRYEQWDGKGYPDGLNGNQIPVGARILAVADAYGVMTTVRPYRAMVYSQDAVAELRRCAGAQFDPNVVDAFCGVLKREG